MTWFPIDVMKVYQSPLFVPQNVVGIGAGIVDGLGFGDNTKAAVIRLGLMEIIKFTQIFLESKWAYLSVLLPV